MPTEYIGNELHNVPVVHPNREMDERPAFLVLDIGWTRREIISQRGPTQYGDPRCPDPFGYPLGCGSD